DLFLTQSAISKQIAQLEATVCQALFHRSARGLSLTPAGRMYLGEVRSILNQVDASARYVMGYGEADETLTIAVQPTFGITWLVPRLRLFLQAYPHIQVVTKGDARPFDLMQSRIDISLFYGEGSLPGADCHRLFEADVAVVCAPEILPAQGLASLAELEQLPMVQCSFRPEIWRDWFACQGFVPADAYRGTRFDTFSMCLQAAQEGIGMAIMPRMFAEQALAQGRLVQPWPFVQPSDGAYYVAHASHCAALPKIRHFVDWVLAQAHASPPSA
ncbi:LysR family transcriptional regulator, partial [Comamonas sp.]